MTLVIDLETVPLASALAEPYPEAERNPPSNYKNPEAISGWRLRDEAAWQEQRVKECSVNPRLGRVLCLGWQSASSVTTPEAQTILARTEDGERVLLDTFWKLVTDNFLPFSGTQLVTWNGAHFDLRFLVVRSLAHKITPPIAGDEIGKWFRRYSVAPHFDCMAVLTNWSPKIDGESLDAWAKFFGLNGKPDGMDGSKVYELYQAGKLDEIASYCKGDVAQIASIYEQIAPMFSAAA